MSAFYFNVIAKKKAVADDVSRLARNIVTDYFFPLTHHHWYGVEDYLDAELCYYRGNFTNSEIYNHKCLQKAACNKQPGLQQGRVLSFSYSSGYPSSAQTIPFRTLQAEIVDKHLLRSLDQLTELEQQVLTAKYIWNMRNTEAADYLGISSDAVRHAEYRAMRKLEMKLKASV